jgi:dTDP-glucose 4,6-dehydratase
MTNIIGVQNLLEMVRAYEPSLRPLFVHISTDEVYGGSLTERFDENSPLNPSNPYAASKAAAEHIVRSYSHTYDIKYQMIRMSNNYGRRQYPEKLIPRSLLRLLHGKKAQLHGDGTYQRVWLHVEDAVDAILKIITKGEVNTIYNISSDVEMTNNEVLKTLTDIMGLDFDEQVEYVANRPGQDLRYCIDYSKVRALGWEPKEDFREALAAIVEETRIDPHWGSMAPKLVGRPVPYPEKA